jgi:hypothetical protein
MVARLTAGTNILLRTDRVNLIRDAKVGSADGKAQLDIPASMGGTALRSFPGIYTTTTLAADNLASAAEDSVIMNSEVVARRGMTQAEIAALKAVAKARCGKGGSIDLMVAEARNAAGDVAGANVNKSRVGLAALMVREGKSVAGRAGGAGVNKSVGGSKGLTTIAVATKGTVAAKMNADTSDGFKAIVPKAGAKCMVAMVFMGTAKVGPVAKSRTITALEGITARAAGGAFSFA